MQNPMIDWLKSNGLTLTIVVAGIVASYSINTALYGYRLSSVEARQDRQGVSITAMQATLADVQSQYAAINAKLDAMSDNVNYIRSRIDK